MGFGAKANGNYNISIGYYTTTTLKYYSTAIGYKTTASETASTAMGRETTASGKNATAMGYKTIASEYDATAMGDRTTASGMASTAMGGYTTASGNYSTAMGNRTEACGYYSTAMGYGTIANSDCETAIGSFNTSNIGLFVVGNGEVKWNEETESFSDTTRSDALIIYKNGNAEFRGNIYPAVTKYDWQDEMPIYTLGTSTNKWNAVYATEGTIQTSDQRLKTNIKPLERALDKVLTLNGVTYEWRVKEFPNKNFDSNRHVGVLAQELEAVLPEAVETGADGYKSVNYSNITPLLIEAVKELKAENDELKKEMAEMKKMLEELMKK